MRFMMPYGTGQVSVSLPEGIQVQLAVPAKPLIAAADEQAEISRCLKNPVGGISLSRLAAQTGGPAAVIISDYSRCTPTAKILPAVLSELNAAGIGVGDIAIISAGGLHRPSTAEEMREMVGGEIYERYRVTAHDPENTEGLKPLGKTCRGTPVFINKLVADARIRVTIGTVEPHQLAGWSGGGKNLVPGVAGQETVIRNHSLAYGEGVAIGRLKGNPVYEDIIEVADSLAPVFMVNVLLDEQKNIVRVFAGDLKMAHFEAARVGESLLGVEVPEPPDVIIASVGGSPRDKDFWQTEGKALVRVLPVIKKGGKVVILSECRYGIGHPAFAEVLKSNSIETIINGFDRSTFTTLRNKTYRLARLLQKADLYLVTGYLTKEDFPLLPVKIHREAQKAVEQALSETAGKPRVLVLPRSGSVLLKPAADS